MFVSLEDYRCEIFCFGVSSFIMGMVWLDLLKFNV
jgi:hypothetical protein